MTAHDRGVPGRAAMLEFKRAETFFAAQVVFCESQSDNDSELD